MMVFTTIKWNKSEPTDTDKKQSLTPIQSQHFNPLNPNPNKHLICSTKTLQLCYKRISLRSIRFLLGLWYLSWRPWWWESTVNRFSFSAELLLYKIITDSEKNPCWGAFVDGVYRKKQQLLLKTWPSRWNAISQASRQTTTAYFAMTMAACLYT